MRRRLGAVRVAGDAFDRRSVEVLCEMAIAQALDDGRGVGRAARDIAAIGQPIDVTDEAEIEDPTAQRRSLAVTAAAARLEQ